MLIRHTDSPPGHHFRNAQVAGFIKEYTSMQKAGFAKDRDYLMVFIGEPPTAARFFALYYIANRFQTRADHVPEGYPNRSEVEEDGDYLELREVQLPQDLKGFTIEWGKSTRMWHHRAETDKRIIEINQSIEAGGAQS